MKDRIARRGLAAAWLLLAAQAAAAGPAVDAAQALPPAGLYRIDTEGELGWPGAPGIKIRQKVDGATGTTADRRSVNGASSEQIYQGSGAVTHCVKLVNKKQMFPLPASMAACTVQSTSAIKDGFVHTSSCPHGNTTLTVQRIGPEVWEYTTEVEIAGGGGAPGLGALKPVLAHAAAHGATKAERDKAAQQLKELPAMESQMAAERAAAAGTLARQLKAARSPEEAAAMKAALAQLGGAVPMRSRGRERWTRIGHTCNSL